MFGVSVVAWVVLKNAFEIQCALRMRFYLWYRRDMRVSAYQAHAQPIENAILWEINWYYNQFRI